MALVVPFLNEFQSDEAPEQTSLTVESLRGFVISKAGIMHLEEAVIQ